MMITVSTKFIYFIFYLKWHTGIQVHRFMSTIEEATISTPTNNQVTFITPILLIISLWMLIIPIIPMIIWGEVGMRKVEADTSNIRKRITISTTFSAWLINHGTVIVKLISVELVEPINVSLRRNQL